MISSNRTGLSEQEVLFVNILDINTADWKADDGVVMN